VNAQYVASGRLGATASDICFGRAHRRRGRIFWAESSAATPSILFRASLLAARIIAGLDAEIHVIERTGRLPPASLDGGRRTIGARPHVSLYKRQQS
jgi:hypothetical protein